MNGNAKKIKSDALSRLVVFDRLEVGPPKIEKHRIITPYRLFRKNKEERFRLIYTYQENVFDPKEPESQNLASMITSQVALNYGLFCDKIIFHGVFDLTDQRFLRDMAENTSREIYVKKFLEPIPTLPMI